MFDCNNLLHPFQNDPGVSQQQRVLDDLITNAPKIDGRRMADLLDFFVQLSRHINYYDKNAGISDWRPFFQRSLPFTLAAIVKFDFQTVNQTTKSYTRLFGKHPSAEGLQLFIHFIYFRAIVAINNWHLQLKDSGLPAELVMVKLIKDKLSLPLGEFICCHNVAVRYFCIKAIDFRPISQNEVWGLTDTELHKSDCLPDAKTRRKRLLVLHEKLTTILPSFLDAIRIIAATAEQCMEQSLFPLKEELQKKHTPHLALLFSFLKLFRYLQCDLNTFTRKHLDFFFKTVLKIEPKEAVPDKAHLVFEIQKQLDTYLLEKGLLAKDGKDNNKAEVLFALDDEIVINKAKVADTRTLFLNNQYFFEQTYLEGVYMAPNTGMADGISAPFKTDPHSFPTLGAKLSKYGNPEKLFLQPYPNARLGFILASPVLLLNEGKRTVDITLGCELKPNFCNELPDAETPVAGNCCEEMNQDLPDLPKAAKKKYDDFFKSEQFYEKVIEALAETYYYISQNLLIDLAKKGISKALEERLRSILTETKYSDNSSVCYCPVKSEKYDAVLTQEEWDLHYQAASDDEKKILDLFIKPLKPLKLQFSGENEWIAPATIPTISITPFSLPGDSKFLLKINTELAADQPAVTFYNKEKLKEEFNTTLPLVKIELEDKIKLRFSREDLESKMENEPTQDCCLLFPQPDIIYEVSLYHFFRNVIVTSEAAGEVTQIQVKVCGLKNIIVQNEESVQDVNGPIFPFGTRPRVGASFYIGSKELFSKDWREVYVNAEWKDKPKDFGVHYKHYSYKDTIFEDGSKEIVNSSFLTTAYVLDKGLWRKDGQRRLFKFIVGEQGRTKPLPPGFPPVPAKTEVPANFCNHNPFPDNADVYDYTNGLFAGLSYERKPDLLSPLAPYNVASQYGFLRFTLDGVSFQYDIFPFVLARQLMAYAGLLSLDVIQEMVTKADQMKKIIVAMISDINDINLHIGHIQNDLGDINANITLINSELNHMEGDLNQALGHLPGDPGSAATEIGFSLDHVNTIRQALDSLASSNDIQDVSNEIQAEINLIIQDLSNDPAPFPIPFNADNAQAYGLVRLSAELNAIIDFFVNNLQVDPELKDGLPSEPYTPVIKSLSLDYTAMSTIEDINLIHLYPYENTYKHEAITLQPGLLPTFCDEGNVFIGLQDLAPGSTQNILFQLAEATADTEYSPEEITWYYLENNQWKKLRTGFEVLDDATHGLTASGIIKFALPENMTNENSILPKGLYWIKASVSWNSRSVCETIGIHTQAVRSTFTNEPGNDKQRLALPLAAGSVTRLNAADTNLKKLSQPYDSFGGRVPEAEGHFYVRVSEWLRHKGRAIQKYDYEHLVLEAFPKLFKVKCINHSFALNDHRYRNDFPIAPGYVILAVIPDLNQLKAAQSYEPRVPVSMLDDIERYMHDRISPFVRFRAMNPRYESVNFCVKVKLLPGKDEIYYKEKLKQDIRELLAPWAVGKYDKLSFGQCVNRSDIIRLLEAGGYVDFILDLCMVHEQDSKQCHELLENGETVLSVCPKTPRSILIAGDIDVCITGKTCESWNENGKCNNDAVPIADYCAKENIG